MKKEINQFTNGTVEIGKLFDPRSFIHFDMFMYIHAQITPSPGDFYVTYVQNHPR